MKRSQESIRKQKETVRRKAAEIRKALASKASAKQGQLVLVQESGLAPAEMPGPQLRRQRMAQEDVLARLIIAVARNITN